MKTKTIALVEIAIVLCSMLLSLPGIAADQTTQKVSANTITAASEIYEPGPLDVFGNANEDDAIDMRDTTYIKLVIFGKKPKTDFADANYDGKVSMLDVGQTKLIILGKEKKLTYVDIYGEAETVNKPIKRMVNVGCEGPKVIRNSGARDILAGVGQDMYSKMPDFYPEMSKLPHIAQGLCNDPGTCDFEAILSLEPDVVMTNIEATFALTGKYMDKMTWKEKLPGIPIICLNMRQTETLPENVRTLGYILDREKEAKEFAEWIEGYLFNTFISRTEGLSEDEKPRIYFESGNRPYEAIASGSSYFQAVRWAGGRNILDELVGPGDPGYTWAVEVDPEWVIEQNPEIIFVRGKYHYIYTTDDPSEFAAARQAILDRPELATVDAVKNRRVYVPSMKLGYGTGNIVTTAYLAKLLHPNLFTDVDPEAIHQEYVDKFCYIDFDVREHGVYFYPPPKEW